MKVVKLVVICLVLSTFAISGVQVTKDNTVEAEWLSSGAMAGAFDGGGRACPEGMVSVGPFCIDTDERAGADFWDAAYDCVLSDGHMCDAAEFSSACTADPEGLLRMNNNWEWVNEWNYKPFGVSCLEAKPSPMIMGQAGCNNYDITLFPNQPLPYRCCAFPIE